MNNCKRKLQMLPIIFLVSTAFIVVKPLEDTETILYKTVQASLVQEFYADYYEAKYYPDTTLLFQNPSPNSNEKNKNKKFVVKSLVNSGIPNTNNFEYAFAPETYVHSKEFNEKFIQHFGKGLHGKHIVMAAKDYENKPDIFFFYSAEGIKAAFNKLYPKPNNTFEKVTYQQLYNLTAKAYTRDLTRFFAYLMGKKTIWLEVSNHFLNNAKTNKKFSVHEEEEYAFKKLFPTEASRKQFPNLSEELGAYELGTLLRRQCDGTLPVILSCLKTVLKDYDPEALKLVNGKF